MTIMTYYALPDWESNAATSVAVVSQSLYGLAGHHMWNVKHAEPKGQSNKGSHQNKDRTGF